MKTPTHGIDMMTFKLVKLKKQPKKYKVWLYQFKGMEKPRQLLKDGKYWYYNDTHGEVGCDSLEGAKGDIVYGEGKVWHEWRVNK